MLCAHSGVPFFNECRQCSNIHFPNRPLNYFELFGLKPSYHLDLKILMNEYFRLSQIIHPDKFYQNPEISDFATTWFAEISKGYETLRSPMRRAEYVLEMFSKPATETPSKLPPDLALEYFELQEFLEENQDTAKAKTHVQNFLTRIQSEAAAAETKIDQTFSEWEVNSHPQLLDVIAGTMNYHSYLTSMKKDLERKWQM